MSEFSNDRGGDLLAMWLALELRRARAAFDESRRQQDADFESKKMRKVGVRVKLTLKSASEICVALADATIAKSTEYKSSRDALRGAREDVLAFTKDVANSAIPLAFFVSGETGVGGSVVKAATERGRQLCRDIDGAFTLADRVSAAADAQASRARAKNPIGRPKGAGAIDDAARLAEMRELISRNPGLSVRAAARHVEPKAAQPNSTPESTIRRLVGKYSEFGP